MEDLLCLILKFIALNADIPTSFPNKLCGVAVPNFEHIVLGDGLVVTSRQARVNLGEDEALVLAAHDPWD